MKDPLSTDLRSINGTDFREECVGVTKLRDIKPDGTEVWDAWCCTHSHWLNGRGAKSVMDKMIEDLRR